MVILQVFRVSGTFKMGDRWAPFHFELAVDSEDAAKDRAYSLLGSRHHADRRHIKIEKADKIQAAEVTDVALKHRLGAGGHV